MSWYQGLEIHEIFCESAGFIETAKTNNSSNNDSIFFNTKNRFLLQFLNRVYNSKGHAYWQGRWDCNGDQIKKLDDEIQGSHNISQSWNHAEIGDAGNAKENEKKFDGLPLKYVLLFFWEEDYADELALKSCEVGSGHTYGNSEGLSVWLELIHFFLWIDLDDGSSFIDIGWFINNLIFFLVVIQNISFFYNWNWLPREGTLIDKCASFKDDTLERDLNGIFQKYNISRNNINWWHFKNISVSEGIHFHFVIGHLMYFDVQSEKLVNCDGDGDQTGS